VAAGFCWFSLVFTGFRKGPILFYDQSSIYEKSIKDVGCREWDEKEMGYFYDQSPIYEKFIKDVGCRDRNENAMRFFYEQSSI
jgi:hypothetical protein